MGVLSETCTLLIFKRQLHHINVIKSIYNCSSVNTIQDKLTCCATIKKLVFTVAVLWQGIQNVQRTNCNQEFCYRHNLTSEYWRLTEYRNVPVKSKLQNPPRQPPGLLNFGKCLFKSSLPCRKAVQMPHHRSISADPMPPSQETLPDYCFHFSVASNMLPEAVYINIV